MIHVSIPGILLQNDSQYPLEYVTFGYNTGYPEHPVREAFQKSPKDDDLYILPPKSVGAMMWRVNKLGNSIKWAHNIATLGASNVVPTSYVEG